MALIFPPGETPKIPKTEPVFKVMLLNQDEQVYMRILYQHEALRVRGMKFLSETTGIRIEISGYPQLADSNRVYICGEEKRRDRWVVTYSYPSAETHKNAVLETLWELAQQFREPEDRVSLGCLVGVDDIYEF